MENSFRGLEVFGSVGGFEIGGELEEGRRGRWWRRRMRVVS